MRADLLREVHILPRAVNDVLADATAAGCSKPQSGQPTYAWALHRQTLLLWKVNDGLNAAVRRLQLPEPPAGRMFVEIIPHRQSSAVTVAACTGAGQLCVWLDANFPATPFSQRLFVSTQSSDSSQEAIICALAASPADSGSSLGFLAVIATSDAALHLYHGSQNGIFPRQFYKPSTGPSTRPGMLGAISGAFKALYGEAFDPLHHVQRSSASCMAALQLQLLQLDSSRWKLLVLTPEALDCWLLGTLSGQQSTEQLLWSFNLHAVLLKELTAREIEILGFATSAGQAQQAAGISHSTTSSGNSSGTDSKQLPAQAAVYVWSGFLGQHAAHKYEHAITCFALEEGNVVPRLLLTCHVHGATLPQPQLGQHSWQMAAHDELPSCLMLSPDGTLLEWLRPAGSAHVLDLSTQNLAITYSGSSSNWQLFNEAYGVLEFAAQSPTAAEAMPPAGNRGVMTVEQEDAAKKLLHKTVELMLKEYAAGCPYRDLAQGLGECLDGLGVLSSKQGRSLLVAISSFLADSLPKSGTLSSSSLRSMLSDKGVRHDLLLAALIEGGVLQQLPAQDVRAIFEHAQMLSGAAAVLEWQRSSEAAAKAGDASSTITTEQTGASAAAIAAAGSLAAAGMGEESGGAGQHWEIFFSRPTVSMPALFNAVAAQASVVRQTIAASAERSGIVPDLLQQLLGLSGLLQAAVSGAVVKADQLTQHMPTEARRARAEGPSWLAGEGPRKAWLELAEGCLLLQPYLPELAQQLQLAHSAHLPALMALLAGLKLTLEFSSSSQASLAATYKELPWKHGQVLLQVARGEVEELRADGMLTDAGKTAPGQSSEFGTPIPAGAQQALVWPLQSLAEQHRCHELLFDTCEVLASLGLPPEQQLLLHMKREMAASKGELAADSFTFYVMQRWYQLNQIPELLQLGQEGFEKQLHQFLSAWPNLLWMSQVQSGQLKQAARTLAAASTSTRTSVAQARRLMCLTKIAAHALGPRDAEQQRLKAAATAQLRRLQLQEELLPGRDQDALLTPEQLVTVALRHAEAGAAAAAAGGGAAHGGDDGSTGLTGAAAAVAAVEALALELSNRQSESYKQLWHESWQAALNCSDLQQLVDKRAAGYQDSQLFEDYNAAVVDSPLVQAFGRAAAALQEAAQVQADISPGDVLAEVARSLLSQAHDPRAAECLSDLIREAATRYAQVLAA